METQCHQVCAKTTRDQHPAVMSLNESVATYSALCCAARVATSHAADRRGWVPQISPHLEHPPRRPASASAGQTDFPLGHLQNSSCRAPSPASVQHRILRSLE